eukprot:UN25543
MSLRFQMKPGYLLLEANIDRPITIGNFEMRNFRVYVLTKPTDMQFGFGLDMKAKFGTVAKPSDLHLRGDVGVSMGFIGVPTLGLSCKVNQLSQWDDAFGITGLTISNVFFEGGIKFPMVYPTAPILDKFALGGMMKLPSGVR